MTKNETGTWGLGRGTWDSGKWGRGTRECRDAGTWGLGDEGRVMHGDSRTWEVGTWGCDKQTSPDFCAEFVKYIFGSPVRWLIGTKLFHRVKTLPQITKKFHESQNTCSRVALGLATKAL